VRTPSAPAAWWATAGGIVTASGRNGPHPGLLCSADQPAPIRTGVGVNSIHIRVSRPRMKTNLDAFRWGPSARRRLPSTRPPRGPWRGREMAQSRRAKGRGRLVRQRRGVRRNRCSPGYRAGPAALLPISTLGCRCAHARWAAAIRARYSCRRAARSSALTAVARIRNHHASPPSETATTATRRQRVRNRYRGPVNGRLRFGIRAVGRHTSEVGGQARRVLPADCPAPTPDPQATVGLPVGLSVRRLLHLPSEGCHERG
jgi:hypothetical protein